MCVCISVFRLLSGAICQNKNVKAVALAKAKKAMNIYNLVSAAFVAAGLDESDFLVRIQNDTTLYVSIYKKNTHKKILLYIGLEDDNYVSDFVVWEENLSPVIGLDAYERFTQRIQNETYISV